MAIRRYLFSVFNFYIPAPAASLRPAGRQFFGDIRSYRLFAF